MTYFTVQKVFFPNEMTKKNNKQNKKIKKSMSLYKTDNTVSILIAPSHHSFESKF